MGIWRRIDVVALVLALVGLVVSPARTWGQADERIGTVLAVDGTAEVRAANATAWEPLQFRAAIFLNDTVRTAANSKLKVLLRDDSIMTLAERSEMHFTESVLTPQQRRTVVSLAVGKLKVLTTGLFGGGSATEVRTPNTVAGVRGTTFVVIFIPPDITQVIGLDGVVTVRSLNPAIPQIEPIPPNFSTQVTGNRAPGRATAVPLTERQAIERELRLTEQVPAEVQSTRERQAAGPIRGEGEAAGPGGPQVLGVTAAQLGELPAGDAEAQLNLLLDRTQTVNNALASEPVPPGGGALIQPDSNPAAMGALQGQPSNLRLTITIPR